MKKLLVLASLLVLTSAALLDGAFQVKPNKENVIAGRILGVWTLDEEMTHLLGASKATNGFVFVRDEKVAAGIPETFKEQLPEDIYLAGTITKGIETGPFVLTTANGNMRVVMFHSAGSETYGKIEAFNVTLCPALERNKDMLFVGGEKNDRPFAVFVRKNLAPDKG